MKFEAEVGSLVEFRSGDEYRLGWALEKVGKKFVILTESEEEMRATEQELTFGLGKAGVEDRERGKAKLKRIAGEVLARQGDVDAALLWEFVREEEGPVSAKELAELIFSDEEPATVLATIRGLREDRVYFKARRDGAYEARSGDQVEVLKAQVEAEERRASEEQEVYGELSRLLDLAEGERGEATEEALGKKDRLRNAVYLLQDYAAQGEDFLHREAAEGVLDGLVDYRGKALSGRQHERAFRLMVALGLWDEYENLSLRKYRIAGEFPSEVMAEVREVVTKGWEPEEYRVDLRGRTTVTIDAESSKDLDDGLSCQPRLDGGWEVMIHIADPSAVVKVGSALDGEARRRGSSVYLADGMVPMFPRELSEGLMSLNEGEDRPAMTTRVVFDEEFEVVEAEVVASVIRVDRRMSYDEVDEMLATEAGGRYGELVKNLGYVAEECYRRREERGAFAFDLPETRVVVDKRVDPPEVEVEVIETATASRTLVSEMMILNNEVVGKICESEGLAVIYRIQESPDEDLEAPEILAIPEGVARIFAQIKRMKRGEVTTQPGWHFGLGVATYAQASSPIRRYADLLCQRQLKAHLSGEGEVASAEEVLEVLATAGSAAGDAGQAEKETSRFWLLEYLRRRQGEELEAVVVEHKDEQGSRVAVFLKDCAYRFNGTLRTKVEVGDPVKVVVERVDPRGDRLHWRQASN